MVDRDIGDEFGSADGEGVGFEVVYEVGSGDGSSFNTVLKGEFGVRVGECVG